METFRLKLARNEDPNGKCRTITVEKPSGAKAPHGNSWRALAEYFAPDIPAGEHLVQCIALPPP